MLLVGTTLELKHIVDTNIIRQLTLYKLVISCKTHLKQLYMSNKVEHFGNKGGCGIKRRVGLGYRKWYLFISNVMSVILVKN